MTYNNKIKTSHYQKKKNLQPLNKRSDNLLCIFSKIQRQCRAHYFPHFCIFYKYPPSGFEKDFYSLPSCKHFSQSIFGHAVQSVSSQYWRWSHKALKEHSTSHPKPDTLNLIRTRPNANTCNLVDKSQTYSSCSKAEENVCQG